MEHRRTDAARPRLRAAASGARLAVPGAEEGTQPYRSTYRAATALLQQHPGKFEWTLFSSLVGWSWGLATDLQSMGGSSDRLCRALAR